LDRRSCDSFEEFDCESSGISDPAAGSFSGVSGLCLRSAVFPGGHLCFWCQAAAVRPRVPLLVAMILCFT